MGKNINKTKWLENLTHDQKQVQFFSLSLIKRRRLDLKGEHINLKLLRS